MTLMDPEGTTVEAVYFGQAEEFADYVSGHETVSVAYYPEINVYQGRETLQIVIRNYC